MGAMGAVLACFIVFQFIKGAGRLGAKADRENWRGSRSMYDEDEDEDDYDFEEYEPRKRYRRRRRY